MPVCSLCPCSLLFHGHKWWIVLSRLKLCLFEHPPAAVFLPCQKFGSWLLHCSDTRAEFWLAYCGKTCLMGGRSVREGKLWPNSGSALLAGAQGPRKTASTLMVKCWSLSFVTVWCSRWCSSQHWCQPSLLEYHLTMRFRSLSDGKITSQSGEQKWKHLYFPPPRPEFIFVTIYLYL